MFPNHDISVPPDRKSGHIPIPYSGLFIMRCSVYRPRIIYHLAEGAHFTFELLPSTNQSLLN